MKSSHWILGAFGLGLAIAIALFVIDARRTQLAIDWHPGALSTFIDPLYPPGRWERASNGEQIMTQEPGYADIRIMKKYRMMSVAVKFENPDSIPVRIGMRTSDGDMDLRDASNGAFTAEFGISKLRDAEGRAQLIISAPKLREGAKPITIQDIAITYTK